MSLMHLAALHQHGSKNPLGVKTNADGIDKIPFHPYFSLKDLLGLNVVLFFFFFVVFYFPDALGHPDNYIPANPMSTPPHIVPE